VDLQFLAGKSTILISTIIFLAGVSTILLRRHAVWSLVGQVIAVKSVAATGFLLAQFDLPGGGDLAVVSLVAAGLVPLIGFVGILVLHRCGRFGGTLDYDEEDHLRN
jgi:hypothetical protein